MPNSPVNNLIVQKAGTALTGLLAANGTSPVGAAVVADISNGLDLIGATWGDILFRGTAGWEVLAPGTAGKVLSTNGPGADPTWIAGGGGSGDVVGPASAVNLTIAIFDGTTGKLIKDTAATIAADGSATFPIAVSSAGGGGINVSNSNSGSSAKFNAINDTGASGGFGIFGSAFPLASFQNTAVIFCDNSLLLLPDGGTGSGGSKTIDMITGGYGNSPTFRLTGGNPGRLLLGSMTDDGATLVQIKTPAMSHSIGLGAGQGGIAAYGCLSFNGGRTTAAAVGIVAGASGDDLNMYVCTPTGGAYYFLVNAAIAAYLDVNGFKTSAPAGSTDQQWKFGNIQAGGVTPDLTRSVFVDIGGVSYKLIVST